MANSFHKTRTGIPGVKGLGSVVSESAWGEQTATSRYGGSTRTFGPPKDACYPQKHGDPGNLQGPRDDIAASDWRRGGGQGGESRPDYVGGYRAPRGEPGERAGALSERQQKAKALAQAIESLGAWVISPLPLDDGKRLRVRIADSDKNRVLQGIRDLGFEPQFVTIAMRTDVATYSFIPACDYEIPLAPERQFVVDDRHTGEIAKPEKPNAEVEGIKKYLGLIK